MIAAELSVMLTKTYGSTEQALDRFISMGQCSATGKGWRRSPIVKGPDEPEL